MGNDMDIFTKQKFVGVLIIVLIITNALSLSVIWFKELNPKKPPPPPPKREQLNNFLGEQLKLTPEQNKLFNKYRQEHLDSTIIINERVGGLKKQILAESFNQNPDLNKINALSAKIGSIQKEYEEFLSRHFQNLASVCNPEQKEKLKRIFVSSFGPQEGRPDPGRRPPPERLPPPR